MSDLSIDLSITNTKVVAGEALLVTVTIKNISQAVVACHDMLMSSWIEYTLTPHNSAYETRYLSYALYQQQIRPIFRKKDLEPAKKELKPGESEIRKNEKISQYAIPPLIPDTYDICAQYNNGKEVVISQPCTVTIMPLFPAVIHCITDNSYGKRAVACVQKNNNIGKIYQIEASTSLPDIGTVFERWEPNGSVNSIALAISGLLKGNLIGRWIAWAEKKTVFIGWGSAQTHGEKIKVPLDIDNPVVLQPGIICDNQTARFIVVGQTDSGTECVLITINISDAVIVDKHQISLSKDSINKFYLHWSIQDTVVTASLLWINSKDNVQFVNIASIDWDGKIISEMKKLQELGDPVLALHVNPVYRGNKDTTVVSMLTENAQHKGTLLHYSIPLYQQSRTPAIEIPVPPGPVHEWVVYSTEKYNAPIIAVTDNYIVWFIPQKDTQWKTLAHSEYGFQFVTMHLLPKSTTNQFRPYRFWIEWHVEGVGVNMEPIPWKYINTDEGSV